MAEPHAKSRPPVVLTVLSVATLVMLVVDLWAVFFHAPVELQMGIVQKIFYFHVPSAYAMYVGYVTAAVGSAVYLIKRKDAWDAVAVAGAEVGFVFCLIVLITGPLWARKAWGVFWTWDPRLTTTLLAGMVFAAYLALRSFGGTGQAERRFAAGLAIVGVLDLPIIHYSVQRWQGQHPTVITGRGGGLDPDMATTLMISFVFFTLLVIVVIWTRARAERMRQRIAEAEIEAARRGLLEDS